MKINLKDDVILDTFPDGEDRLRLAVTWGSREVLLRFPSQGHWDQYTIGLYFILQKLARNGTELMQTLSDESADIVPKSLSEWAMYGMLGLSLKKISKDIHKLFMRFLRPKVTGIWFTSRWIRRNAPIDGTIQMLCAIAAVEQWIQKKTSHALMILYGVSQNPIRQQSTDIYMKSGGGVPHTWEPDQSSQFVSF